MTKIKEPPGDLPSEIAAMSFEAALSELEDIVRTLEQGRNSLDEAISSYERGSLLKKHCEKKLEEARMRVEKITVGPDGKTSSEPLDFD
ncbi:MAG: exodeoxyribonuclease VII small subunit [Rhodospirillaceae bacterium]|jgi:exodeoxyribonuclease VII small subunit